MGYILVLYREYIGIMEKKMETTNMFKGLGAHTKSPKYASFAEIPSCPYSKKAS